MDLTKISKHMSYLLRHSDKLPMSTDGYVEIDDLLLELRVGRSILDKVVETNNKSRFEIQGNRIRACQGHSRSIVQDDAMQDSWIAEDPKGKTYYHGTIKKYLPRIMSEGLMPMGRTHVHLAPSMMSRVGKRKTSDVVLTVDGDILDQKNIDVFKSSNGVILVSMVPPEAIYIMS